MAFIDELHNNTVVFQLRVHTYTHNFEGSI